MSYTTQIDRLKSELSSQGFGSGIPSGKETKYLCPCHDDTNPSLCVREGDKGDGTALAYCHACGADGAKVFAALRMEQNVPDAPLVKKEKSKIVATYDYRDERGNLLFQSVRYEPKDFRQRVPDGKGGWNWTIAGVRKVPYLLPELLASPKSELVFVVEGEKDCDVLALIGLWATCNPMGAGKWKHIDSTTVAEAFRDRLVVIIPDNDAPGRKHAREVAESLTGIAKSIWVLELPGLAPKGDVSDWLAAGGTKDGLLKLADSAPTAAKWIELLKPEIVVVVPEPTPAKPLAIAKRVEKKGEKLPDWLSDNQNMNERVVLGSMLGDVVCCCDIAKFLTEEDFQFYGHRVIFKTILEVWESGGAAGGDYIPSPLVADTIHRAGKSADTGGLEYLKSLRDLAPTSAGGVPSAKSIKESSIRKQIYLMASALLEESCKPTGDADALLAMAQSKILSISTDKGSESTKLLSESMKNYLLEMEERCLGRGVVGVASGLADLDKLTSGLHKNELTILAARPSCGKTALAAQIAVNAAKDGHGVLFISLEQSDKELAGRLLSGESGVDSGSMRRGRVGPDDIRKLCAAQGALTHLPVFINDSCSQNVREIYATARRLKMAANIGLVVIDYLQLVEVEDRRVPRHEAVAGITRRLKFLAKELEVPVLCLAQLNRKSEESPGGKPKMSHLRESGSIEQDADTVILLHREERDHSRPSPVDNITAIIEKQRNGETGEVKLIFRKANLRFENAAL